MAFLNFPEFLHLPFYLIHICLIDAPRFVDSLCNLIGIYTNFSDRTLKTIKNFDYTELPMVDQLIADFFVLDDATRKELFDYLNLLKKNHSDPERKKCLNNKMS